MSVAAIWLIIVVYQKGITAIPFETMSACLAAASEMHANDRGYQTYCIKGEYP